MSNSNNVFQCLCCYWSLWYMCGVVTSDLLVTGNNTAVKVVWGVLSLKQVFGVVKWGRMLFVYAGVLVSTFTHCNCLWLIFFRSGTWVTMRASEESSHDCVEWASRLQSWHFDTDWLFRVRSATKVNMRLVFSTVVLYVWLLIHTHTHTQTCIFCYVIF